MTQVQTVKGPIDTADLGPTLMHEHVFVLTPDLLQNYPNYPASWDEEERVTDAIEKLRRLAALGVRSIVDPTVVGLGRYIPRVQRIANEVDLNIIAATGLYTYDELPHTFNYIGPGTAMGGDDPMVDMFIGDITDGIAGTGVKAAFLKCAIDQPGLTQGVERVLRAVAKAHRATGAPITVHTFVGNQSGLIAQQVFRDEGVDLTRVVIGHSGDSTDLDYLKKLADAGSILGMDRFGAEVLLPTADRINTIVSLCADGYADRMVLAHDASCYIDWFNPDLIKAIMPNWHYEHISNDVLPALREAGVTDDQIRAMMEDNPRRYFEKIGPY
jgi:phosphotriesterase-related protein